MPLIPRRRSAADNRFSCSAGESVEKCWIVKRVNRLMNSALLIRFLPFAPVRFLAVSTVQLYCTSTAFTKQIRRMPADLPQSR